MGARRANNVLGRAVHKIEAAAAVYVNVYKSGRKVLSAHVYAFAAEIIVKARVDGGYNSVFNNYAPVFDFTERR
jgi:hypothetical protein